MGKLKRQDFTTDLESVARGVRRLEEIRDPVRRDAIAAALRLRDTDARLDPAARARMRRQVLAAVAPSRPTFADSVMTVFAILAKPAPALVRIIAVGVAGVGLLASATVASADSLPDDALYGFKLAGEQLRLSIASTPEDRAAVNISIAAHRLDEAERLAEAGRDDATIEMTAAFGLSLATAAADLASADVQHPKLGTLVAQLQAQLHVQQERVGTAAVRLAADPRTAGAAAVLAAIGPRGVDAAPSAVRIADAAAAVTARLVVVAETRATRGQDPQEQTVQHSVAAADRRTVATARPVTPRPTAVAPAHPTAAPVDLAAAREAALHAQRAAEAAQRAAARARESHRTPPPSPRGGTRAVSP